MICLIQLELSLRGQRNFGETRFDTCRTYEPTGNEKDLVFFYVVREETRSYKLLPRKKMAFSGRQNGQFGLTLAPGGWVSGQIFFWFGQDWLKTADLRKPVSELNIDRQESSERGSCRSSLA